MTQLRRSYRWTAHLAGSLALSAFFLYLALRGQDWSVIGSQITAARYRYLFLMGGVGIYVLFVRAQRWQLLLEQASGRPNRVGPLFSATAIGFMANMLLPFRVGEVARPYLASRHTSTPLSMVFATVLIERLLDLLILFCFAMWTILTTDVPSVVKQLTWVAGAAVIVILAAILALHFQRARLLPVLNRLWRLLPGRLGPRIERLENEFLDGIATIADLRVLLRAVAWSLYLWGLIAVGFGLGFLALNIEIGFLAGGVAVTAVVALAVSIPSAPAFVGQFEWGCKIALEQIQHVGGAQAVGFSLLTHVTQFVTQVGLGVVYLLREGLSLSELGRMKKSAATVE